MMSASAKLIHIHNDDYVIWGLVLVLSLGLGLGLGFG